MTELEARHLELVGRVNNCKTRLERFEWFARLCGFREGVEACGGNLYELLTHADEAHHSLGVVRPMHGGVFLDWEPQTDIDNPTGSTKGGA